MTEQLKQRPTDREILSMSPEEFSTYRERVAFIEGQGKLQSSEPESAPVRAAKIVTNRPEGVYVNTRSVLKAGGVLGLVGGGILAGAFLFGGNNESPTGASETAAPTQPGETAAPTQPGETAKPTPTPEPTQKVETSGFVAKETNTAEGWYRTKITLVDGSELEVDELDYDPITMSEGKTLDKGAVVGGDAKLDGKFNTDSNKQSGQITVNNKEGAKAGGKYGYAVYENFDPSKTDLLVQTVENGLKSDGCGLPTGCKNVLKNSYEADGTYHDYNGSSQTSSEQQTSTNTAETQHPADCQCTLCCNVVTPTPTPSACPTPEASHTPEKDCVAGYDHDLENIYRGNLAALKKDVANGKNKEYLETVKPGEKIAVQGDVVYLQNGKLHKNFDNNGATGAVSYISVPEGGDKVTVYMVYGGDIHRLETCTSEEEAKQLVKDYINGMEVTYGKGHVKEYDVR